MEIMTVLLVVSVVINIVLASLLALQRVRAALATSALAELIERVTKLEATTRTPQKIVIVGQNNKESLNEQSTT